MNTQGIKSTVAALSTALTAIGGTLLGQDTVDPDIYMSISTVIINVFAIASVFFRSKGIEDHG
jgi:ABC-type uncharacterized transport system permease subunit